MFLSYRSLSFIFIFIFASVCNLVSSDDIPVILWNIKGNTLHIKPVSALGHNDKVFAENLKDIHHQETTIVAFAVDKLSLEDFSSDKPGTMNNTLNNIETFLDTEPHMLLPSVKDPLNYIHKAHCGVQEIVVDNKIDESILHSVSLAIQRSCVVILHISNDGIISSESDIKSVFLPSFENSDKKIVGIFTGVKSSWGSPNDHHIMRNLLQAQEESNTTSFLNTSCIIMYSELASLQLGSEENNTVTLPFPPSLEGSSCENNTRILQMTFKTTGAVSSVVIKFEFPLIRGSWKTVATLSVTGEKESKEEIELNSDFIEAPVQFSFSCGDLVLNPINQTIVRTLKFKRFQIQPYEVKDAFSDSFDCITFFTIPIWMGIIVSLLFIVITNIGVYALFSVRTMDRFDDPKGKTISVAAAAD